MALVLVVGSTGQLGRAIVRRLRQDGMSVRALVRPTSNVSVVPGLGAEIVVGDLRDPESLRRACRGCDAVVTTASSLHSGFDFERIDRAGNLNLIAVAGQERVRHFVFTSTVAADAPDAPRIFRNKRFMEERLAVSGLRYTILRPAGFMENLIPLIHWVRRTGLAIVPGSGIVKTSYIAIRDIAEIVYLVLAHPPAGRSVIELAGPDDLAMLDCVALMEEALGRRVRVCHIPLGLLRFVGRVAQPFTQAPDALFEILDFVERRGLRVDKSFLAEFPIPLTSFRSFLREELERVAGR